MKEKKRNKKKRKRNKLNGGSNKRGFICVWAVIDKGEGGRARRLVWVAAGGGGGDDRDCTSSDRDGEPVLGVGTLGNI